MKRQRCAWAKDERLIQYHDEEWGRPCRDDARLFELLVLESFQAGLSWTLVLKKREAFVEAFEGFDPKTVASFGEERIGRLLQCQGIIRNCGKIAAAVQNAKLFLRLQEEYGSFSNYIWGYTGGKVIKHEDGPIPTTSPLSDAISGDLRKRGMRYMGSVIVYSYLGAIGVVNDHERGCFLC